MATPGLKVVRSSIHGYGVLAARAFAAGETVAQVAGVPWRDGAPADDRYCLWMGDGRLLDMADETRWINHSCGPNVRVARDGDERAWLVALADIAAGDELAYDYAFPPALAEPCHCGSPRCRGLIIDADAAR